MRLLSSLLVLAASVALAEEAPAPDLPEGAVRRLGTSDGAHAVDIVDAAFTPDGKLVVSIDGGGAVRAWDVPSLHPRLSLDLEEEGRFLSVSPKGDLLAVGQSNGVFLFSLPEGKPSGRFYGPPQPLLWGAFSPDGKRFAATDDEGGLHVWDAEAPSYRFGVKSAHGGSDVDGVLWAGERLVTWDDGGAVKVWDVATEKELRTILTKVDSTGGVSLSPDGKLLVVAGDSEGAECWDIESGEPKDVLSPAETGCFSKVAFSADGQRAAWTNGERQLLVCSVKDRELLVKIPVRSEGSPRFSPDGAWLLTGIGGCRLVLHHADTGKSASDSIGHEGLISSLEFDATGKRLFSAGADGRVLAWDLATGASRAVVDNGAALSGAMLLSGGSKVMTCTQMGELAVWDVGTGKRLGEMAERPGGVASLAWAGEAGMAFVLGQGGRAEIWDAGLASPLVSLEDLPVENGRRAAFRPDGRLLACSGKDGIALFNARSGDQRAIVKCPGPTSRNLAFSPDGALLAYDDQSSNCFVVEVDSGLQVAETTSTSPALGPVFAAGDRLVVLSEQTLAVLDLATMAPIGPARPLPAIPTQISVSADGHLAATAFPDGTILVWELPAAPAREKPPGADALWEALGKDPDESVASVLACAAAGPDAVKALADGLAAVLPVPVGVTGALAKLGSENVEERESAENILRAAGGEAEPALRAALRDAPPENRLRIEAVLSACELPPLTSPALLQRARALQALEHCGSAEARAALKKLAQASPFERERRLAEEALKRLAKR